MFLEDDDDPIQLQLPANPRDSILTLSSLYSNFTNQPDENLICDPCFLGVDPEKVIINESGGGWEVREVLTDFPTDEPTSALAKETFPEPTPTPVS
jgi:hypothetical protein